jgi:hypothetical protein
MTPQQRNELQNVGHLLARLSIEVESPVEATAIQILGWIVKDLADKPLAPPVLVPVLKQAWEGFIIAE